MPTYSLALVGFGNVGKALARLLLRKQSVLLSQFGIEFKITGIATARHGMAIDSNGLDVPRALKLVETGQTLKIISVQTVPETIPEFIQNCGAKVLFENSPVNHETGQPAIDHIKTGLRRGMHVITANKGPVVHAFAELTALAQSNNRRFMYESTVMDGAPIFSLFRGSLPAAELLGFEGILNSCTNLLIGLMEEGKSFEDAVTYAQSIGIAETDPSADIDGWDASIKVAALATVLMGVPLTPQFVNRTGIRSITPAMIAEARLAGERWKLVCSARRTPTGLEAMVAPRRISAGSPLYCINGTSSYVQFELDVLPGLGIVENNPGPETTAYGLLADFINVARGN